MQESGRLDAASKLYDKALSMWVSAVNVSCLQSKVMQLNLDRRASLLDSKGYLEYRKGNISEAISNLQTSLDIKLKLQKFGAVLDMQLAISHLLRWRSREIIFSKDVKCKKRMPSSPPTIRKAAKKSTLSTRKLRKAMIYDSEI
jgi:hypothetical protein